MRSKRVALIACLIVVAAASSRVEAQEIWLTPSEIDFSKATPVGPGTSSAQGSQTLVLKGDPSKPGLYSIRVRIPANTRIAAHSHPDDRVSTVISGTWYHGHGKAFDAAGLKALPAGSFYTEPPGRDHFAETRGEAVVLQVTGMGPTGTTYVDKANQPKP